MSTSEGKPETLADKAKIAYEVFQTFNNKRGTAEFEDARDKLWVPLEEAQKLDTDYKIMYSEILKQLKLKCDKIDEAIKIIETTKPELLLPVIGKPAVFKQETEQEKGYSKGFYLMRKEAVELIEDLKKHLCEALK